LLNMVVLCAQALAIAAFFLPKRAFLLLLLIFDAMHLSIIIIAGANFWPWILLNGAIGIVVARRDYVQPRPFLGALASMFVLISPQLVNVAYLGWYDPGANNKLSFLAEALAGRRHYVPTNFFMFYSYPFSHMDYGSPDPQTAFAVGSPNGGAWSHAL